LRIARDVALFGVVITCAYTDLARGRIYNVCTLGGLAVGVALGIVRDGPTGGYEHLFGSLLAAALATGIFGAVYLMHGIGGGDVKMMAAIGAIVGDWRFVLTACFTSALVGAAIGVAYLIWRGRLWSGVKSSGKLLISFGRKRDDAKLTREETFPYGVAIGAGTVWAWFEVLSRVAR
jgi:prepilin peptidase CpaA